MAVGGHVLIEASAPLLGQVAQPEGFDDGAGAQVKVLLHQGGEVGVADGTGAKAFHQDAHRPGHADGVAELHLGLAGQSCSHQGLGHVAGGIGGGAVHLGGVLAGEGAAAVAGIAAVGVHNDFAAGQARIALGAAHHELARGVHQEAGGALVAGGFLEGFEGEIGGGGLHHMAPEIGGDALPHGLLLTHSINFSGVLGGDQNGVDGHGHIVFVDNAHLGFAIGQQVLEAAVVAHFCQPPGQPVGQADGQGHQLRGFVAGVAKHDALIARPNQIEGVAGMVVGLIYALGNVG